VQEIPSPPLADTEISGSCPDTGRDQDPPRLQHPPTGEANHEPGLDRGLSSPTPVAGHSTPSTLRGRPATAVAGQEPAIEAGFMVRLAGGRVLKARRILVATGVRDELPEISGVAAVGTGSLALPVLPRWEVRDQPIGVLGTQPGSAQHAQLVRQWSDDVAFFVHTYDLTAAEHVQLEARGVRIVRGEVARLVVEGDRLTGVELIDGSSDRADGGVHPAGQPASCRRSADEPGLQGR